MKMEHLFLPWIIRHRILRSFAWRKLYGKSHGKVDSAGSIYCKQITVYVVDTTPADVRTERTTRFIDEKYYGSSYERGGLLDDSIWKTDTAYVSARRTAFEIWKMMHRLKPMINADSAGRSANMWMRTDSETTEKPEHYRKCMIGILCQIV